MTKSKSSAPSIVFQSIFMIHLMDGAQFLNATSVAILHLKVLISPHTRK